MTPETCTQRRQGGIDLRLAGQGVMKRVMHQPEAPSAADLLDRLRGLPLGTQGAGCETERLDQTQNALIGEDGLEGPER